MSELNLSGFGAIPGLGLDDPTPPEPAPDPNPPEPKKDQKQPQRLFEKTKAQKEARISLLTSEDFKKKLKKEAARNDVNLNKFILRILELYMDGSLILKEE